MKPFFLFFLFFPLLLNSSPSVLVSIAPHKYFVESIAGDTVSVIQFVPKGISSHTYEPTPKQIMEVSCADIWFQMGEFFEPQASKALKNFSPQLLQVDLRNGLSLLHNQNQCCHHQDSCDPHIWLSPKLAKQQAQTIFSALVERYPKHHLLYKKNLELFLNDLDQVDKELSSLFAKKTNLTILVSHPAYGYLARDYQFEQLSIETEGKDPSPRKVHQLLEKIKKLPIHKIFIQPQHSAKGAETLAKQIDATLVELDPYSENYTENLLKIGKEFTSP